MASRPSVSILIVTWQSGRDIETCLDSIHSRREFEVIVVDNASTDDTRARLDRYHHLTVIANERNLGYARATNQGLAACRGEHVLMLNPDTKLEPGAIDALLDHLDANPGHAAVAPRLLNLDGTLQRSVRGLPTPAAAFWDLTGLAFVFSRNRRIGRIRMAWFDYDSAGPAPQPMASCLVFRRKVLVELGGMDERLPIFYNDVDLSLRMAARGLVTWYLPTSRVFHARGASTGQARPRMLREQYRSLIRCLAIHDRSGWFWLKSVALVPLAGLVMLVRTLAWRRRRRG
ncbi:MAG: glycosyltransferase family 2 protein [bacterium]